MRTVTTNKTTSDFDLMEQDMKALIAKSVASHQQALIGSLLFDELSFSNKKPIVTRRVNQETTRKRTVSYPQGYWAKIEINDTDHVTYKVFNSGWLAKTFNKIGFRKVLGHGWDSVTQRDKVEATLGATYMAIDEAIAADLKSVKHSQFLKEMIKTDPDNLKAIAQLDMLDKGDGPGAEASVSSTAGLTGAQTYSTNIAVSGSGTYSKVDTSKPATLSVGQIDFNAGGGTSVTIGDEEAVKVDPDGSVSFGNKMAKAIKEVATEKGEVNES